MPLSRDEQRLLDGIENALRADDPAFEARLTLGTADRRRRLQMVLVHGSLWLGMFMALAGFALIHQVLAAGVLLILYGAGALVCTLVMVLRLHTVNGAPQRVRRSAGGAGIADPE
jgi:hypothetical protein